MEPKVNYLLVGLSVVVLGVTSLAVVLWLSKGDYRGIYDRYYTYMRESVSGLSVDSAVRYRGVEVGRVKEIILDPENPEEARLGFEDGRGVLFGWRAAHNLRDPRIDGHYHREFDRREP